MSIPKGNLSTAENYVWKWPDPTASELRRFIERDFGKYLINALRDVGVSLGFMSFARSCPPVSTWLNWAGETIPEEMKGKLLHIAIAHIIARWAFPSLDQIELDVARREITEVMIWLKAEFPAAGVEHLPGDFGS